MLRRAGRPDVADRRASALAEAAAIQETFFTVWANVFQLGKLRRQHSGPRRRQLIGTTAVLLCHALGMTVYATVGGRKNCCYVPMLRRLTTKTDDFAKKIGQLTNDEGVDVILDIVGDPYFNRNLGLLKKDGRLVIIGTWAGESLMRLMLNSDAQASHRHRLDHARPDGGGETAGAEALRRRLAAARGREMQAADLRQLPDGGDCRGPCLSGRWSASGKW